MKMIRGSVQNIKFCFHIPYDSCEIFTGSFCLFLGQTRGSILNRKDNMIINTRVRHLLSYGFSFAPSGLNSFLFPDPEAHASGYETYRPFGTLIFLFIYFITEHTENFMIYDRDCKAIDNYQYHNLSRHLLYANEHLLQKKKVFRKFDRHEYPNPTMPV